MVDPGEDRTATLIREFGEEACNTLEASPDQKEKIKAQLTELFTTMGTDVSEMQSFVQQGSHKLWKSLKTWKITKKKVPYIEKSWNLKKPE